MPLHNVNGQWIYYEDTGGEGTPVVLAHGILMDHEMFAPQVRGRKPGCRMITWDARCHGQTETTNDPFTYWDSADDLTGLLDHLEVERAVIGGMSQGGFVSLRFALQHPERTAALVLMNTQAGAEDPERLPAYRQMQQTWLTHGPVDELTQTIADLIIGDPQLNEIWIAKWKQLPREVLEQPGECLFGRDDISDRLGEISCPAIVFHGTADRSIEMELAIELCEGLSGCERVASTRSST